MTGATRKAEIAANWQRALESLQAAEELLAGQHPDIAASRAYYAAHYAAVALLLSAGKKFGKHSGVIAALQRDFVKPGRLSPTSGKDLAKLFELRNVGDYGEIQHVDLTAARCAIESARKFTGEIRTILLANGLLDDKKAS